MQANSFQRRQGAGARAQVALAALTGVVGFIIGWAVGVEQMGWRLGLLVGWWPALLVGAGSAWVVGIGAPELTAMIARRAARARAGSGPRGRA